MGSTRPRYLFIRILEACNADCFMCGFALSKDTYRFSVEEFTALLPKARAAGVRVVRFTGGEPLIHRDIVELVRLGSEHGMKMSIITNGMHLPRTVGRLVEAGLSQVIVSLDGATPQTHDLYRRTPRLFDNGTRGLAMAGELGVITRVNTVVGPHNYVEIPELQRVLTRLGVQQWELSSLKLEREMVYSSPEHVLEVCDPVYAADHGELLVPLGKRFYGDTPLEREVYFTTGNTPRASLPLCHVTDDVIYLDGKYGRSYACSCLPHRSDGGAPTREGGDLELDTRQFQEHADHYRIQGPRLCTGCSTTAAGYSDDVERLGSALLWSY